MIRLDRVPQTLLLGFGLVLAIPAIGAADSILTCVFSAGTAGFYENVARGKPIEGSLDRKEAAWTVVFAGLDTNRPRIKGNLGEDDLVVLRCIQNTLWLGETPPLGGVNVWTIFLEHKTAILSKQYELPSGPIAVLSMAKCR